MATQVVKTYLCENNSGEERAAELLQDRAFAYKGLKKTQETRDAFQSPLLLQLFGITHLQDTQGWVDIPGLNLQAKCEYGVAEALALCTTAVWTFVCWQLSSN